MVKVVTIFLIGIAILAMFGKLRLPMIKKSIDMLRLNKKCPKCGAYKIGNDTCVCQKK